MIILADGDSSGKEAVRDLRSRPEPLPRRAYLASRAAAAVARRELSLCEASRRYRTPIADIQVWQRALESAGLDRAPDRSSVD